MFHSTPTGSTLGREPDPPAVARSPKDGNIRSGELLLVATRVTGPRYRSHTPLAPLRSSSENCSVRPTCSLLLSSSSPAPLWPPAQQGEQRTSFWSNRQVPPCGSRPPTLQLTPCCRPPGTAWTRCLLTVHCTTSGGHLTPGIPLHHIQEQGARPSPDPLPLPNSCPLSSIPLC